MIKRPVFLLQAVLFFILLSPCKLFPANPLNAGLEGMKAITPDGLKEQLAVIASEKFEGRETSYPGQKLAAHYIASQFQQMGLLPAGDSGTFFQHFPLLHITVDRASRLAATVSGSSTAWTDFGEDYFPSASGRDTVISGEVEFVGYGINSKMLQFTEYDSSKDYRGKIVLVLRGTPDEGDTSSIFHDYPIAGTSGAKRVYAQRSGAAAVLVVEDTKGRTMEDAFKERMDDLTRGAITIPGRARNDIPLFSISRKLADELLTPSGKTIEELQREIDSTKKPDPFSLKDARVTIDLKMRCDSVTSENIVGILPGSDSVLKNEYVVFSAHYDHLGKNVATGEIYYGADDDGSGTCSVIEMAHAFASLAERPKRSLIFLTVSGEEKGLLGSLYYTDHPAIPLSQTVTDLNADMIGRFDPQHEKVNDTNYVYVIGSDKLSMQLDSISKVANEESENLHLDYTFDDESDPHQYYRRSDHYNFARKNVPIIFYFDGEHPDYHKPTDRIEKINFGVYTKRARLIFYTGWKIANAPNRPALDAEKSTSPFSPDR